jgi:hypothetical protein
LHQQPPYSSSFSGNPMGVLKGEYMQWRKELKNIKNNKNL